jgi:hypothetical protein
MSHAFIVLRIYGDTWSTLDADLPNSLVNRRRMLTDYTRAAAAAGFDQYSQVHAGIRLKVARSAGHTLATAVGRWSGQNLECLTEVARDRLLQGRFDPLNGPP